MKTLNSLLDDYPNAFRSNPFECRDGWYNIILPVVQAISEYNSKFEDKSFHVYPSQVKEKFSTLRIYLDAYPDELEELIDKAERASATTCEVCGEAGELRRGSWLVTRCESHK